ELALERQLGRGALHRLASERLGDPGKLEHHATRLDDGDPALRVALARAHPGLGRLPRVGLVGECVNRHLPAAAEVTRGRGTSRLDLAVRDPRGLERDQAEVTEMHLGPALSATAPAASTHLAALDLLRREDQACSFGSASAAGPAGSSSAAAGVLGAAPCADESSGGPSASAVPPSAGSEVGAS